MHLAFNLGGTTEVTALFVLYIGMKGAFLRLIRNSRENVLLRVSKCIKMVKNLNLFTIYNCLLYFSTCIICFKSKVLDEESNHYEVGQAS